MVRAMTTLGMMYPARGGLVWGQMRGCHLKSRWSTPLGDLYNILLIIFLYNQISNSYVDVVLAQCPGCGGFCQQLTSLDKADLNHAAQVSDP